MRRLVLAAAVLAALSGAPGALAAGWCGSGETLGDRPDVLKGAQVRAVYAVPSDGADRFAEVVPDIVADLDSMNTWWLSQDPTRSPRTDVADFGNGCVALDIASARIAISGLDLTRSRFPSAFQRLSTALTELGLNQRYKKYVVYYDGPPFDMNVCGTSAGNFLNGPSFAVVWLAACPGVPHDYVATHELAHALGAVPNGASHTCPISQGHVCDSTQDLLYPLASGAPLTAAVLDVGHDDYYAHPGGWADIQDSAWLRRVDLSPQPLSVAFSGAGHVISNVPGLDCRTACTTTWDGGSVILLNAEGVAGSTRFVGWRGACSGNLACEIDNESPTTVTAVFGPLRIPVRLSTAGRGGIACAPRCGSSIRAGTTLRLTAMPARGWRFAGWSGACRGTQPACRPATDFALSVRATFRRGSS